MQKLSILNSKQKKELSKLLKEQFDSSFEFPVAMQNEKDEIYLINKDISNIDLSKLKIDTLGLLFGEIKGDEIRLTIEGSQLVGPSAKKNVLKIDDKLARLWLKGYDIPVKTDMKGFVIIKNNNDYLGCGKFIENRVTNLIPKNRRILATD